MAAPSFTHPVGRLGQAPGWKDGPRVKVRKGTEEIRRADFDELSRADRPNPRGRE